jgi:hypothetical protein
MRVRTVHPLPAQFSCCAHLITSPLIKGDICVMDAAEVSMPIHCSVTLCELLHTRLNVRSEFRTQRMTATSRRPGNEAGCRPMRLTLQDQTVRTNLLSHSCSAPVDRKELAKTVGADRGCLCLLQPADCMIIQV